MEALWMVVTNGDDGYARWTSTRVLVCTEEKAREEAAKAVGTYTYLATLYAVTDEGYAGARIADYRKGA